MLAALCLTSLAPAPSSATAAGHAVRYVDDDGRAGTTGCDGTAAAPRHIQDAVDASGPGDTVVVCPGRYTGQVVIRGARTGLTIRSAVPFGAVIASPRTLRDLPGGGPGGILVAVDHVDRVTVQGFRLIVRTAPPCSDVAMTVAVLGSRDAAIRGNRLLAPGASTGSCLQIDGIVVADSAGGSAPRRTSATVAYNEVRDAVEFGIVAVGEQHLTTVHVVRDSVRAYFGYSTRGNGARRSTATGILRAHPPALLPPDATSFGIAAIGRTTGEVRANVVQGAPSGPLAGPAVTVGLYVVGDATGSMTSGARLLIRGNLIRRTSQGVSIADAQDIRVRGNTIHNTVTGMTLSRVRASVIRDNDARTKQHGLALDASSTGNRIQGDSFDGPGGTCRDRSHGSGTGGTANTWTGDTAMVASVPSGICAIH